MNASKYDANFFEAKTFKFTPESEQMINNPFSWVLNYGPAGSEKQEKAKAVRQAEVLIPYQLHPSYIKGIYVVDQAAKTALQTVINGNSPVPIDIYPTLFFHKCPSTRGVGFNKLETTNPEAFNLNFVQLTTDLPISSEESISEKSISEESDDIPDMVFKMDANN